MQPHPTSAGGHPATALFAAAPAYEHAVAHRFSRGPEFSEALEEQGALDLALQELRQAVTDVQSEILNSLELTQVSKVAEALTRKGRGKEIKAITHAVPDGFFSEEYKKALVSGVCRADPNDLCHELVKSRSQELGPLQISIRLDEAGVLLQKGKLVEARQILESLKQREVSSFEEEPTRGLARRLIDQLSESGEYELAIDLAANPMWRSAQYTLSLELSRKLAHKGRIKEVGLLAQKLHDQLSRIEIANILAIAVSMALETRNSRAVDDLFRDMEQVSGLPIAAYARSDDPLADATKNLVKAGMHEKVLLLADLVPERRARLLAIAMAEVEKAGRDADLVGTRLTGTLRSSAYAYVVVALADLDRGDRAQELLNRVEYGEDRSPALAAIARWQGRQHHLVEAVQTAESCSDPAYRLAALTYLLGTLVQKESPDLAPLLHGKSKAE